MIYRIVKVNNAHHWCIQKWYDRSTFWQKLMGKQNGEWRFTTGRFPSYDQAMDSLTSIVAKGF